MYICMFVYEFSGAFYVSAKWINHSQSDSMCILKHDFSYYMYIATIYDHNNCKSNSPKISVTGMSTIIIPSELGQ